MVREVVVDVPIDIDWSRRLLRSGKDGKTISAKSFNVRLILENDDRWAGVLAYSELSYQILKLRIPPFSGGRVGEWCDADSADLRHWLAEHYGFEPRTADGEDAVLAAARGNCFHPIRAYLESLAWDGHARLDLWLYTYLAAQEAAPTPDEQDAKARYLRAVGPMWMIGAVARVLCPPVKMDNVLILEGPQGVGKSTALQILGGDWFTDSHFHIGDKDGYQFIRGVWIVEMAELDSFNKVEATRAKQFFGSMTDRYRASFGRHTQEWARQCVFAGSTNQGHYLKDATGNRRYWPVTVGAKLDLAALSHDRDQLWAEALHRYRQGSPWWPSETLTGEFSGEQESRFNADVWQDLVEAWLDDALQRKTCQFTGAEIMEGALKLKPAEMKPPEQTRVGMIMGRLRWNKARKTVTVDSKKVRKWVYERPHETDDF